MADIVARGMSKKAQSDIAIINSQLENKAEQADLDNVSSQLAQNVHQIVEVKDKVNRELISKRNRKPMITIIDDDGRTDFLTKWEPILKEKTCKVDIAVITGWVGNSGYMTWEDLERLKAAYDIDLVNHTHTHRYLADISESEMRWEMENSVRILKERGHSHDIMVYPYGSNNAIVRQVTREYCRTGINISGGVNTPPLETFRLFRQGLTPQTGTMSPAEVYTQYIDEAIAKNGWIIFMNHSQYSPMDVNIIKAVIDYANSKGIEWVHTREGLDRIGNLIDTGDYVASAQGSEFTILDANGVLHSKTNSKDYRLGETNSVTVNSLITDFQPKSTTICQITSAIATGFPENKAGILETFRGGSDSYSYQQYRIYNSNNVYKRFWNASGSSWGTFERIDGMSLKKESYVLNFDFGSIAANTLKAVNATLDGLTTSDRIIVSPKGVFPSGLMISYFNNVANTVTIRIFNTTASPISLTLDFNVLVMKA